MFIKHIIISGRVQGVGFRQYVLREARKLRLNGWVRNLADGRVEVLVSLEQECESHFILALKKGPLFSKVDDLELHGVDIKMELPTFEVKENSDEPFRG